MRSRQFPLRSAAGDDEARGVRGGGGGREGRVRRRRGGARRRSRARVTLIKSSNPHLAGGEKVKRHCKAAWNFHKRTLTRPQRLVGAAGKVCRGPGQVCRGHWELQEGLASCRGVWRVFRPVKPAALNLHKKTLPRQPWEPPGRSAAASPRLVGAAGAFAAFSGQKLIAAALVSSRKSLHELPEGSLTGLLRHSARQPGNSIKGHWHGCQTICLGTAEKKTLPRQPGYRLCRGHWDRSAQGFARPSVACWASFDG